MVIDSEVLDNLSEQARSSPRLRKNLDLRNSTADGSQRMLNALELGTIVPVHRHRASNETVAVLRGAVRQNFYDEAGLLTESVVVAAGGVDVSEFVGGSSFDGACAGVYYGPGVDSVSVGCPFFVVPKGVWHNTECLVSGTVIFEAKDGAYEPMGEEDVM